MVIFTLYPFFLLDAPIETTNYQTNNNKLSYAYSNRTWHAGSQSYTENSE